MSHLITASEFFDCGLPVSDDIRDAEIEFATNTIEQYMLVPFLGDLLATVINEPSEYTDILNAPDGLKQTMYHFVFAYLLYDRIRLTRFSSVIKNDEHSTDPSSKDIMDLAKMHWEIATVYLLRNCEKLNISISEVKRNDLMFNELLY